MNLKNKPFRILMYTFLLINLFNCKKSQNKEEIEKFKNDKNITDEAALYGISRVLFKESLKSFKSEQNPEGNQEVTIEYGGNRAYTFYSGKNYSEKIQMEVVRYILLFFQSGSKRNLKNLRISLVKPYFVKEPEAKSELTEEFEVFRASISYSDLLTVNGWDNSELISDKKNPNNSNVIELFNQVRLKWKIELNELYRIEVK